MDGKLILDTSNPVILRMSNDAYYYFFEGEDPIDESSLDEIAEISASFEHGFEPDESKPINTDSSDGSIEVTIFPYIEDVPKQKPSQSESSDLDTLEFDESQWDGVHNDGSIFPWLFYFKFIGENTVKIAQLNMHFNKRLNDCIGEIVWLNNKPWIKYKTKEEHKGYSFMPIMSPRTTILDNQNAAEYLIKS